MRIRLSPKQKIRIANSKDIFLVMREILKREHKLGKKQEHFWIVGLDLRNRISYIELMALGIHNMARINTKQVFKMAVFKDAEKIIAVHNHPSGIMIPSDSDKHMTESLKHGGNFIGIKLEDHLIISEKKYFSFKDKKLLK
jgi:DNA repair protein RadC